MVSENNDHYENSDSNCDDRMREGVHSPLRVALMPLFKHIAINSKSVSPFSYMGFSSYWHHSPQSFKEHEHYTFYGFVMALPKWETNFGAEMTCVQGSEWSDRSSLRGRTRLARPG